MAHKRWRIKDFKRDLIVNTRIQKFVQFVSAYLFAAAHSPTQTQLRSIIFASGICLLAIGLSSEAMTQVGGTGTLTATYNDDRIVNVINALLTYIEGAFGALIMIAAGLMAIISSAMGQYKAALGLLVVAVGAFILRSLVGTFFNDEGIQG